MDNLLTRHRLGITSLLLLAVTLVLYWPVQQFGFLNFDDALYVSNNPNVQAGLTPKSVVWAFQTTHASNWHPLTWLSHMLDCQLYGLKAGGHHLTSLLFHLANTLLLFGVLRRMTGALVPSACVAALFAIHPLHLESVAWVAERKDVLSTFFGLVSVGAYARYAERPGAFWYTAALAAFAAGLLAKPMLVTLPFVLLLLDYWPLQREPFASQRVNWTESRVRQGTFGLLREKAPFLALSLVSCGITFFAQKSGGAIAAVENIPMAARVANALVAYAGYLWKTIWPANLAAFYPHPISWPSETVVLAALTLAAISAGVYWSKRRYLLVGWLWYLGTLVPVIGLVQVGDQAMADRYTYVPLVGIFLGLVWGAKELISTFPRMRPVVLGLALGAFPLLFWCASFQLGHWRDSQTLFTRALAITQDNYIAHNNLANALVAAGQYNEARPHYLETLRLRPDLAGVHYNLANVLAHEGEPGEATRHYRLALERQSDYAEAHYNLGVVLATLGQVEEAIAHERDALRQRPGFPEAHNQLGNLLMQQGKASEAAESYRSALTNRPDYLDAMVNLGSALERLGELDEAAGQYSRAAALNPDSAHAQSNLAVLLARQGRLPEALEHFRAVVRIEPGNANAHYNLANALVEAGKFKEAATQYAETVRLNPGDTRAREKLARYSDANPP